MPVSATRVRTMRYLNLNSSFERRFISTHLNVRVHVRTVSTVQRMLWTYMYIHVCNVIRHNAAELHDVCKHCCRSIYRARVLSTENARNTPQNEEEIRRIALLDQHDIPVCGRSNFPHSGTPNRRKGDSRRRRELRGFESFTVE